MSNWTHVAGIIRVDGMDMNMGAEEVEEVFDRVIGKECLYDSPSEVWEDASAHPDQYLPMGSQGSLRKTIWKNPDKYYLDSYTISIFGDLRDHDSTTDIIEWFKAKCEEFWVRNAVITITVENKMYGTETYTYE